MKGFLRNFFLVFSSGYSRSKAKILKKVPKDNRGCIEGPGLRRFSRSQKYPRGISPRTESKTYHLV